MPEHHIIYEKEIGDQICVKDLSAELFEPHGKHVLVEPLPPEEMIGRFFLPERFRKEQALGWVRQISPDDTDGRYQVGDLVVFVANSGRPVNIGGKDMLILQYHSVEESEILGRFPKECVDSAASPSA